MSTEQITSVLQEQYFMVICVDKDNTWRPAKKLRFKDMFKGTHEKYIRPSGFVQWRSQLQQLKESDGRIIKR